MPITPDEPDPLSQGHDTADQPRRVLLVDDNVDYAEGLALLLEAAGYQVNVKHNGPDALRCAVDFQPDIVLLDIGLAEMDGYEIAGRLRQVPALSCLRVVAVSGYPPRQQSALTQAARFDKYLMKPMRLPELIASFV